jgi:epoxyqueuosine reductase
MLINPRQGSFLLLGALLVDADLPADEPFDADRCGSCTRCLDACPTHAFPAPRVLDARRCIAYLTIELRGPIDEALRPAIGELLFGCDICQDVCPWNERFATHGDPTLADALGALDPLDMLSMQDEEFTARFATSPIVRATCAGLARTAAIVLGNRRDPATIPALRDARDHHADAIVRDHAAWALAQFPAQILA